LLPGKVVEDEIKDLEGAEVDLAKLEAEVLNEDEQRML